MAFFYDLGVLAGYFAIMIICIILSIILANKKSAWIIYIAGAAVTVLSMIGSGLVYSIVYMFSFIGLLIIGAFGIFARRNLTHNKKDSRPTVDQNSSHKCICGERFYGDTCPNCARKV